MLPADRPIDRSRANRFGSAAAVVADAVAVLVFVIIGRNAHDHGLSPAGVATTAWPFLVGAAVGWTVAGGLVIGRRRRGPRSRIDLVRLPAGAAVWLCTVAVGMVLRVLVGQGTAVSFIAVALAFLGLFLLGWRVLVRVAHRLLATRRRRRGAAGEAVA